MLTADQLAQRAGKIGGSDIGIIVGGDRVKINKLWEQKLGLREPDNLDDNFQVQMGIQTEPLNLRWYEKRHRQTVSRRGDVVTHYRYDWACCTLDGWIDEMRCPIECKHSGGREKLEVLEARYQPQLQWQMEITGAETCALSVIFGNDDPAVEFYKRDADYAGLLLERGDNFIKHVRNKTPPVDLPVIPSPVDVTAVYDMAGNNEFAHHADIWLQLRDSAEAYDDAATILKSMVPADAKRCFGYGVMITRSKLGRLSLREKKDD